MTRGTGACPWNDVDWVQHDRAVGTTRGQVKVILCIAQPAEADHLNEPTGIKITDTELEAIPLRRHERHPEWNYTIEPP